jgi:peptidylprolyl isomerase
MSRRLSLVFIAAFLVAGGLPALAKQPKAPPLPPAPAAPGEADWRTPDPQNVLVLDTNKGRIFVEMAPQIAPAHVARIKELTRKGFYDGLSFFRVIDEFMAQTGDPQNNGTGSSTLPGLAPEFTFRRGSDLPFALAERDEGKDNGFIGVMPVVSQPIDLAAMTADNRVRAYGTFCPGVAGMARAGPPDSANSQFFLMRGIQHALDQQYTAWGRVIAGEDVVRAIKVGEPPEAPADKVTSAHILADMPGASRPRVRVVDTQGPWFRAYLAHLLAEKGLAFTLCDVELPSDTK